jgi:GR25 family glycosyltransferase involved in LPS biosynthesis
MEEHTRCAEWHSRSKSLYFKVEPFLIEQFERIFVINLAKRTDKRDGMTLAAAVSGMQVEYIDAVNGSTGVIEVPNPDPEPEDDNLVNGQKGCWRSHLNILEKIVSEGISSALIMEDDADWDVRIKTQLSQFALATRALSQPRSYTAKSFADPTYPYPLNAGVPTVEINLKHPPSTIPPEWSPYGDNWDLLWLGHCGTRFPNQDNDPKSSRGRVLAYGDPTVPQPHYFQKEWGTDELVTSGYPNHTRVFHHTSMNVCTLAYAVSQAGARRILYDIGVLKTDKPIDLMLRAYCDGEDGRRGGRACFTAQPQYFQHYRPRGSRIKWSDISNHTTEYNANEGTLNIRMSTRMNLQNIVEGDEDYLDQFPDT